MTEGGLWAVGQALGTPARRMVHVACKSSNEASGMLHDAWLHAERLPSGVVPRCTAVLRTSETLGQHLTSGEAFRSADWGLRAEMGMRVGVREK